MPSERGEEPWVDEMDGPERLARAKKRRTEQLERWGRRENTTGDEGKKRRKKDKTLKFKPNIVILEAAARNDLEEVAELLENGVSPDLANEDGLTALHQSCIDGCDDMAKYLIEHKANVNACDKESWTPLHAAVACGHVSIIRYLMKNGGNILALNLDGNFPVDLVDDNDEVEKYLEQVLAELGYDDEGIEELRQNQGKQLLDDLKDSLENGRSLEVQDENGATAFHVAAAQGWTIVVDYLLENEADFEIRDNDGWQPIHAAAAWGQDTVLEILVASGADLDSKTNNSETPLDLSEEDEITELIEELKTNQVKYPRRGKVRRRRSNASNSSIKRSSIHEKNELSHTDTKAEGAALLIQLQNTDDSEANSPDEPVSSPQILETHLSERASNSSKEETGSSGYHSEGSTKSEEKTELSKNKKTTDEAKDKPTSNSGDNNAEKERKEKPVENKNEITEKEEKKPSANSGNKLSSNNIKQSPVPKPPRLMTGSTPREAKAYINLEIEHSETAKVKRPKDDETKKNPDSENIKPSAENSANKTEIDKIVDSANTTRQTATADRNTTLPLPRLAQSDKRKAPEPPVAPKNAESKQPPAKESEKDSTLEKKKDQENETPTAPTKRAAPSSKPSPPPNPSPPPPHRNTAQTQPEEKDRGQPIVNKTSTRGFSFPRTRKTCCLVM